VLEHRHHGVIATMTRAAVRLPRAGRCSGAPLRTVPAMADDEDEDDDRADDEDEDEDDGDGEPWPIARRPPASDEAWVAELVAAYRRAGDPPPLQTDDGREFVPGEGLLESAVALSLLNRGARIPVEAVYGLIGVIRDMVDDLRSMGPEWERMQQVPPLAFSVCYVWTHIVIGHLSEDAGMDIVRGVTDQLDRFGEEPKFGGGAKR
jgi:hypothetical protein